VTRPTTTPFANTRLLSDAEVEALLAALRRDTSPLGLRDAAFILARLRLGVPLRYLQRLQWGMLTHDPSGVWVRWQSGEEPSPLPAEVWEALRAYLAASGRLQGMRPGKFIFAPIRRPPGLQKSARAQGWHEELYITTPQLLRNLKLYGRLAGIPEEKLTLQVLRHTAVRLRLDAGDSMPEIKAFLHGRESVDSIKYRLGFLPELPQEQAGQAPVMADPPDREAKPFRQGQGVKHGFYAKRRPPEGVQAVMAEGARGLAAELEGLRELGRGLLEREEQAETRQAASLLVEAYSKAAARLGELSAARKAEQEGDEEQEVSWAEDFLQAMQEVSDEHGLGMDKDAVRAEALGGEGRLEEEIAAMRYLLRKVRQQALEAGEGREYVRLVEIYSTGCLRLARLLRREGDQRQRLERSIRKWTDKALSEVVDEMGLK